MRNRYDIFGTLPDVIEDHWITDIERLDEAHKDIANRRERARSNAFDLRYAMDVNPTDERWELYDLVLSRANVIETLSHGWGE